MILIAAVDDRMGMCFRGRRVSRDRGMMTWVEEKILYGAPLWMDAYSQVLCQTMEGKIPIPKQIVREDFLEAAGNGDFCFVEDRSCKLYEKKIEKIHLFRWNRRYPADLFFDLPLSNRTIIHQEDFTGSSHDRITWEVYI